MTELERVLRKMAREGADIDAATRKAIGAIHEEEMRKAKAEEEKSKAALERIIELQEHVSSIDLKSANPDDAASFAAAVYGSVNHGWTVEDINRFKERVKTSLDLNAKIVEQERREKENSKRDWTTESLFDVPAFFRLF